MRTATPESWIVSAFKGTIHHAHCTAVTRSLLVAPRWGIRASGAIGSGTAPNALVAARAVPVQPVRAVCAPVAVARRTAPFAVLLVVAVFMKPIGAIRTSMPIARASTVSAFCSHLCFPFAAYYTKCRAALPSQGLVVRG